MNSKTNTTKDMVRVNTKPLDCTIGLDAECRYVVISLDRTVNTIVLTPSEAMEIAKSLLEGVTLLDHYKVQESTNERTRETNS